MTIDIIQLLYYAGFAILGWWLRNRGVALPNAAPLPAPTGTPDQRVLIDLLKSVLDRVAPPLVPGPTPTSNVVHVPIEVAANVKQPQA